MDSQFKELVVMRRWMKQLQERAPMQAYRIRERARVHVLMETGCTITELDAALSDTHHPKREEVLTSFLGYLARQREKERRNI